MLPQDIANIYRFMGTWFVPVLFIIGFSHPNWLQDDENLNYGLWKWCLRNFTTDPLNPDKKINETQICHGISPGESQSYYEALRTFACFTLIAHIGYFFTFNENEGMGKDNNPLKVYGAAALGNIICIAILAPSYKNDNRWKDADPSMKLGWCFWLIVAVTALGLLMFPAFWKYRDMKRKCSRNNNRSTTTNRNNNNNSSNNTSVGNNTRARASSVSGRLATISTGASSQRRGSASSASSHSSLNLIAIMPPKRTPSRFNRVGEASGAAGRNAFPVLDLPRYELPPGARPVEFLPNTPPPSYEEVIGQGGGAGRQSAPPPYLP